MFIRFAQGPPGIALLAVAVAAFLCLGALLVASYSSQATFRPPPPGPEDFRPSLLAFGASNESLRKLRYLNSG